MFGFGRPRLPVTPEDRTWIDGGFDRLSGLFGAEALEAVRVVLPTAEFFPEGWEGRAKDLPGLFARVCGFLGADPLGVELRVFDGDGPRSELQRVLPALEGRGGGPAGYFQERPRQQARMSPAAQHYRRLRGEDVTPPAPTPADDEEPTPRSVVAVDAALLPDFTGLVATLAHELAHVRLLGEGRIDADEPDMEPMTDLCTVFFGLGVFTANAAFRFEQHEGGYEMKRLGYLPEEAFGYALARFAHLRGEVRPAWAANLGVNVREYFRRSEAVLRRERG